MRFTKSLTMAGVPLVATVASLLLGTSVVSAQTTEPPREASAATIVFVCEHGSAKSVIAAAHFNRLATARGLSYHAVARGTKPDPELPAGVVSGLAADGLKVNIEPPSLVSVKDVQGAARTVTIATELPPPVAAKATSVIKWDDVPPVSENYSRAREAIVRHVAELLQQLTAKAR
jgi:protein-tyrosine-phosphatase